MGSEQVIRNGNCEIEADQAVPSFVLRPFSGKFESVLLFHILNLNLLRCARARARVCLFVFVFVDVFLNVNEIKTKKSRNENIHLKKSTVCSSIRLFSLYQMLITNSLM